MQGVVVMKTNPKLWKKKTRICLGGGKEEARDHSLVSLLYCHTHTHTAFHLLIGHWMVVLLLLMLQRTASVSSRNR